MSVNRHALQSHAAQHQAESRRQAAARRLARPPARRAAHPPPVGRPGHQPRRRLRPA